MTGLMEAAALVAEVRVKRLVHGDPDTAARLEEIARHLLNEDEYVDGIERHGLPTADRSYPAGAALGWILRHDAHVRALHRLRGLPSPRTPCDA